MAKKETSKVREIDYDDDSLKAARLAGRNDLYPENVRILGPYARRASNNMTGAKDKGAADAVKKASGSVSTSSATGDDGNTASPGSGVTP